MLPYGADPIPALTHMGFDPRQGFYFYDDFIIYNNNTPSGPNGIMYVGLANGSGSLNNTPTWGRDSSKKMLGALELNTTSSTSLSAGYMVSFGANNASFDGLLLGYGACDTLYRIALEEPAPQGVGYVARAGFWWSSAFPSGAANIFLAAFMEYSPDLNGGAFRLGYAQSTPAAGGVAIGSVSYTNLVGTPNFGQYDWWEVKVDNTGLITALLNGVVLGTQSFPALLYQPASPTVQLIKNVGSQASPMVFHLSWDALCISYPFNRF